MYPEVFMTTAHHVATELAELGAATLGESGGIPMAPRLKATWLGARLAAPAYTVACAPGDNLAIHVAVAQAPPGSVLVVEASAIPDRGFWGEVLTTGAEARRLVGLVIDGGVRDVSALEAHCFPVFSTLVALRGATKHGPGAVGGPVRVGDVPVASGDWIVADADGVTVVPGGQLDAVLAAGRARSVKEEGFFRELKAGKTTVDLLSLDASRIAGA
jgi:4-hydroxy-4-methyl-2-oxoglutarate aldolase